MAVYTADLSKKVDFSTQKCEFSFNGLTFTDKYASIKKKTENQVNPMSEISEILKMSKMPEDAVEYCEKVFGEIKARPELFNLLVTAEARYMQGFDPVKQAAALAEKTGYHRYTIDLILLIYSCLRLRRIYEANGYSEEMFASTTPENIGYTAETCMKLHGIVGCSFFYAYRTFYNCTRFRLGRLHFEIVKMPFDYKDICKAGETVLSCHIPASGPLLMEEVEESLKLAYDFFKINGPMVAVCSSWLLYPEFYKKVFKKGSNLSRFYELFEVVDSKKRAFSADAWRVFGTLETDLDKLPQDTTLQRNLLAFLKEGNSMGGGYGVLVRNYDK